MQQLLRKYLLTIAKGEKSIEKQRQKLALINKFEPYAAFMRIDRDQDGFVNSVEIIKFLRENNVEEATEADCFLIVKYFDSDDDGFLNYQDFLQMLMPCDDQNLRAALAQRPNYAVSTNQYLGREIEAELTKLFEKEIAFNRVTEEIRQRMDSSKQFDYEKAFNSVDDWNYGYIDRRNLKSFLKKHGYIAKNEEVMAIIRRMDLDADARLSKREFISSLQPEEPYSKVMKRSASKRRSLSNKHAFSNTRQSSNISKFSYKPDELLKLNANQKDTIRIQAMDRNIGKFQSSKSPLKSRPVIKNINGHYQQYSLLNTPSTIRHPGQGQSRRQSRYGSAIQRTPASAKSYKHVSIQKIPARKSGQKSGFQNQSLIGKNSTIAHKKNFSSINMKNCKARSQIKYSTITNNISNRKKKSSALKTSHILKREDIITQSKMQEHPVTSGRTYNYGVKQSEYEPIDRLYINKKESSYLQQSKQINPEEPISHTISSYNLMKENTGYQNFKDKELMNTSQQYYQQNSSQFIHQSDLRKSALTKMNTTAPVDEYSPNPFNREFSNYQLNESEVSPFRDQNNMSSLRKKERSPASKIQNNQYSQFAKESEIKPTYISKQESSQSPLRIKDQVSRRKNSGIADHSQTHLRKKSSSRQSQRSSVRITKHEKQVVAQTLKDMIDLEKHLEKCKIDLILQPDFTMIEAFGILDHEAKGHLSPTELREALMDLGLRYSMDEIQLVFDRLNKNQDGRLKYSEFSVSIMPQDQQYMRILGSKRIQSQCNQSSSNGQVFKHDTLVKYLQTWETLMQTEKQIENLRQKLFHRHRIDAQTAFDICNQSQEGNLTTQKVKFIKQSLIPFFIDSIIPL
eukprot:403363918